MKIEELMSVTIVDDVIHNCEPDCDTGSWECDPDYCLPDAYNTCNPETDDDGACDPHYDNV